MSVNIDKMRQPLSPDAPCGEDMSSTVDYFALDSAVRGKPEVQYGDMTQKAEEPDWAAVEEQCEAILSRSKDLRVITCLTVALLCRQGYAGLRDGLTLLSFTVENFWDSLYPRLDPEDDNDPTERVNIIEALSPSEETIDQFLRVRERLFDAPLCQSRQFGRIGLRQVLWASGELTPLSRANVQVPDTGLIQAAFDDIPPDDLKEQAHTVAAVAEQLSVLDTQLQERIPDATPSLALLKRWVDRATKELGNQMARRGMGAGDAGQADTDPLAEQPSTGEQGAPYGAGATTLGSIRTNDDVRKALDLICDFYAKQEPSSPVPLLLKRARRLVGLGFADIIRDLSPDAIHQIEIIGGPQDAGGQG